MPKQEQKKDCKCFEHFQQELHDNNKSAGWWDKKEELVPLESQAAKIVLMHSILSQQIESIRRGKDIDFKGLLSELIKINDTNISEVMNEDTAFLLTKLSLMHSELSEAADYIINPENDKHLLNHSGESVEFSDLFLRLIDYSAYRNFSLMEVSSEKLIYNKTRNDHKKENRKPGGKMF